MSSLMVLFLPDLSPFLFFFFFSLSQLSPFLFFFSFFFSFFPEILDFGFPQNSDVETLKLYITQGGIAVDKLAVRLRGLIPSIFGHNQNLTLFFLVFVTLPSCRRRAK